MNATLRILFVGQLQDGSTTLQRKRALEELGHEVVAISTVPKTRKAFPVELASRVSYKLFRMGLPRLGPWDLAEVNPQIVKAAQTTAVDVLWLDKALTVSAATLRAVKAANPRTTIVGYSPDDMAARHNQSGQLLQSFPIYDAYFTTKTYGVQELRDLGCRNVFWVANAYDPNTHRPVSVPPERKRLLGGPVGFIGTFEEDRARSMQLLASQGIEVRVYGNGWEHFRPANAALRIEGRPLLGDDYAEALCAFDINLCFLRRLNRDRQTQRSVEIPACGAFMLAERTEEHRALFEEGVEADYFDSDEELLAKVKYYLANPEARQWVARAGRDRCLRDGYSYHDRLAWMLRQALEIKS